jgi:hypothetical protein
MLTTEPHAQDHEVMATPANERPRDLSQKTGYSPNGGAAGRNRTDDTSLEERSFTTKLQPHLPPRSFAQPSNRSSFRCAAGLWERLHARDERRRESRGRIAFGAAFRSATRGASGKTSANISAPRRTRAVSRRGSSRARGSRGVSASTRSRAARGGRSGASRRHGLCSRVSN